MANELQTTGIIVEVVKYQTVSVYPSGPTEGQICVLKSHATLPDGQYRYTGSAWVQEMVW